MNGKMKNPKYKISLKGKRKLDYPLKKSRSSVKLPLIGKTIYLDVKENKHVKQLQCDLKRLGATIEDFVSRDINYLITSQPRPRNKGQSCHGDESPAASPFNCEPSPSPLNVEDRKVTSVTRGKALLEKARITRKTNTLLDNAEQWGVKIVSLEGAFKWIDKELKKLPKISGNLSKIQNQAKCVSSYKTLKSPYVKIEAESYCYRPFHLELEVWPRLNVDTPRGSCPFDGTLIKGESREERGDILAAQVDIPSDELQKNNQEDTGNSGKPPTDKSVKKSEPEAGGCILTAGEVKRRKELKRKQERKKGYCECCHIKYEDLDKHVKEERHILYVKNKINYEKLDTLICTGPNSQHFLSECMKKSALLSVQRENKSIVSKSSGRSISPRKSPRKTASPHIQVAQPYCKSPRKNQPKDVRNSLSKPSECSTQKHRVKSPRKEREIVGKVHENIPPKSNGNSPSIFAPKHVVKSPRKGRESSGKVQENMPQITSRENTVNSPSIFTPKHGVKSPRKERESSGKARQNMPLNTSKGNTVNSPSKVTLKHGVKSPRKDSQSVDKPHENKPPKTSTGANGVNSNSPSKLTNTRILENLDSNTNITIANVIVEDTGISNNDILSSPRKMRERRSLAKSAEYPSNSRDLVKSHGSPVKPTLMTEKVKSRKTSLCESNVRIVHDDSNKENIKPRNNLENANDIDNADASGYLQTYDIPTASPRRNRLTNDIATASARCNLQTNDMDRTNTKVNQNNKSKVCDSSEQTKSKHKQSSKNDEHVNDVSMPCKDTTSPKKDMTDSKKEKATRRTADLDAGNVLADSKPSVNDPVIVKDCLDEIVKLGRERICHEASSDDFEVCFARYSKNDELPEHHKKNLTKQSDRTFDSMIKNCDTGSNSDLDRSSGNKARKSAKKNKTHHSVVVDESKAVTETIEKDSKQEIEKLDLKVDKKKCTKSDKKVDKGNKKTDCGIRTQSKKASHNESSHQEHADVYNKHDTELTNKFNAKVVGDQNKSSLKPNAVHKLQSETDKEKVVTVKKKTRSKHTVEKKRQSIKEKVVSDDFQKFENDVYMFETEEDEQSGMLFSKTLAERIKERSDGRRSNVKSYNLNELFSRVSSSERSDQSDKTKVAPEKKLVKKMSGSCIASAKVVNKYRNQRQGNTGNTATVGENVSKGYQGDDEYERTPGTFKSKISNKIKLKKRSPKKFWHYVVSKPSKDNSKATLKDLPKELRHLKDGLDLDLSDVSGKTRTKRSQDKPGDISIASGSEDGVKVDSGVKRKVKKFWHYEPMVESMGNDSDSFKDLPTELRKLKQSMYEFQSDLDNGKRRKRTEINKSKMIDSDSEFDSKTPENVHTNDQEESPMNSDESANSINRKKASNKKFWHYVEVPVHSDTERDSKTGKFLPKELRGLKGPLGLVNSKVESRRRSSTKSCDNKSKIHDSDSEFDTKTLENVQSEKHERNQSRLVQEESSKNSNESDNSITGKKKSHHKKFWHYVTVSVDSNSDKGQDSDKNLPKELRGLKGPLGWVNSEDESRRRSSTKCTNICVNNKSKIIDSDSEFDTKAPENEQVENHDRNQPRLVQEKTKNLNESNNSINRKKASHQKKFWHYVEVPIDSDTDKDHESDKNLPKALKGLKGPLGWVNSEDESHRRSSTKSCPPVNTCDNKSKIVDSDSEFDTKTNENLQSENHETNNSRLAQEQNRKNSDESANSINRKRTSHRKKFWHYVEVPIDSETDNDHESDKNLPKALKGLQGPLGLVNSDDSSRRRSCTNTKTKLILERSSRRENRNRDDNSQPKFRNRDGRKSNAEETSEKDGHCGDRTTKQGANICYSESDTDDLEEVENEETHTYNTSGKNSNDNDNRIDNSGISQEETGINSDECTGTNSINSNKRASRKKFWHYVEVPVDSDTDKGWESDKNLPKALRGLKGPLGRITSEAASRRRSSAKFNNSRDQNSLATGTERNNGELPQDESRNNSDESASKISVKKRAPKKKILWHYIEVPVESDTDKGKESDKNIPKELRDLKSQFSSWTNSEVTSSQHSRTPVRVNYNPDSESDSECEDHVANEETKVRINTNKNVGNSKPIINKLNSVPVNYENISLKKCMKLKKRATKDSNHDTDENEEPQQVPKWVKELQEESCLTETLGRRQRKPTQENNRACGYKIRKKDTNVSYAESDTDDLDEYMDESNTYKCKDDNGKPNNQEVDISDSDAEEQLENDECDSRETNECAKQAGANNDLKKDKAGGATGPKKEKKFWVYVAESTEESDDDTVEENIPKELKQLKMWKMKSESDHGNQRRRREANEALNENETGRKNMVVDEGGNYEQSGSPVCEELKGTDFETITDNRACGSKELHGTDSEVCANKEAFEPNAERKHSKPRSRKRKVYWDYEIVSEDKEEASKSVDRSLPKELRNLQDSWTENVCRVRYVTETSNSKVVDMGKVKSNGNEHVEQQPSVNETAETYEFRLDERSRSPVFRKSPVFNRNQGNKNESRERKASPVFKKSPKSHLFNPANLAHKHKFAQNGRSFSDDYCPDSDEELSDTIDEVQDTMKVSAKHKEIEKAGSGYSRLSREKRRKEWKRKVDSANKSSEDQPESKRRKLDKYYDKDVDDCEVDKEPIGEKLKSPRRRLLTDDNLSDINNRVCGSPGQHSVTRIADHQDGRDGNLTWKPIVVQQSDKAWSMLNESFDKDTDMEAVAKCDTRNTRNSTRECKSKNGQNLSNIDNCNSKPVDDQNDEYSDSVNCDVDLEQFVPALSSPGRSNSSWNGAVESYLDNSLKSGHDLSFRGISFHGSPFKSPTKNVRSSPFKACLVKSATKMKSPVKFVSRTPDKTHRTIISSPMTSPTVTKVDDDIEFNFGSPQKNCTEYSNLRAVKGVVREKTKPVKFNLTSTPDDRKSKSSKHSGKHD